MRLELRLGAEPRRTGQRLEDWCAVSVEAISWALNFALVPADRGGQPSSACKFVLVGLANHARPDGTGAFPSVATLMRYTGLSERTVRTCPDPRPARGRGHHLGVRPGHRGGADQASGPAAARLGPEPEPGARRPGRSRRAADSWVGSVDEARQIIPGL